MQAARPKISEIFDRAIFGSVLDFYVIYFSLIFYSVARIRLEGYMHSSEPRRYPKKDK